MIADREMIKRLEVFIAGFAFLEQRYVGHCKT